MNKEQRIKRALKEVADYAYSDSETGNGFIEYIAQQYDGTIREDIVKAKFGLQDYDPVDDFGIKLDAFNPEDGRSVEIKCTQRGSGGLVFTFKATHVKLDMMEKINPWIYGAGFDPDSGKCAYTLRFRFKGSEVAQRLREDCDEEKRTAKVPNRPSSWNHYMTSPSLEILHFYPEIAKKTLSAPFFNTLASKFYASYSKDDLIKILLSGDTLPNVITTKVQKSEGAAVSDIDSIIADLREKKHKTSAIVDHLNNAGIKTAGGNMWNASRLYNYNYYNKKKVA